MIWNGQRINEARIIQLTKARSVIGDSEGTLSFVAPEVKKVWFEGLVPSHKARIKLMLLLGAGADLERIRASFESAD